MPGPAGGALSGSVGHDRAYKMTSTALPTPSSSSSFSSPAPPNPQQNDSKPPHRKTRSTRGCLTCRKTKVKCDETTPCCQRCEKSGRECHWPSAIQLAFPRKSKRMTGENVSSVDRHGAAEQGAVLRQNGTRNVSSSSSIPASDATSSPFQHHSESMFAGELNDTMYTPSPISMINSSLASRRAAKRRRTTPTTTATALPGSRSSNIRDEAPQNDSQPILIRGIDIEALANAVMSDLTITDLGSSMSSDAHQPDIASAHALKGAFPSTIALQLFQYFYQVASRTLVTMGDKGVNPILTLCTPNRILDTSCAAAAALRMSILSISLAHISNELRTSPNLTYDEQRRTACMKGIKRLAARLKSATLANIVLVEEDENEKDQFDTVLASCVLTMIRDVISGDTSWRENFEYAIRLVTKRGGPEVVLNEDKGNFTRRFLLESLAAHDIFSCFVTHKEPALMDRFEPWWYSCVDNSVASWEWESVERTFGVSRGMLEFFARVATLDAQKRRLGIDFRSPDESMRKGEDFLHRQADSLLLELDVWCNGLNSTAQHVRVKCGDYIYKYSANVFILGSILDYPPESERIVNSIDYVLELCSEATAMRQVVMLVWPLLICGSFCLESRRQKIVELIDAFQSDYCEDLQAAREIILAQWEGIDRGLGRQSFRQVMDRINKCVLLI